ncbi:MAG: flavodoxin family protein [Clostridiales bacterium]|nr:flavodoxin family protein [Clostridiales bacterium]
MSEKKLLAIHGSPHPNGTTDAMLKIAIAAAQRAGFYIERIDLYQEKLDYCNGCLACLRTGSCVKQDSIHKIEASLKSCDMVILAAPVFWANVPAAVKNLFDRLYGTAMEETDTFPKPRLSHKQKYILLTSCNTPFPFSWLCGQSRGALHAMNEFFHTAGMRCQGKFVCTNNKHKKMPSAHMRRRIERCFL